MQRVVLAAASFAAFVCLWVLPAAAQSRVALVIGNSAYQGAAPLKTTAADATLMASTLTAAGFDVVQANDVTVANIGDAFTNFINKVTAAGPNAIAFVYYAGYGAQYNGDSFLVPVDAKITTAEDVQNQSLSLSDIIKAMTPLPAAARIIVLDAARDAGFGAGSQNPVAPGLALVGVPDGFLVAYPAAPGSVICSCAPNEANSPYASSLATLLRQAGLDIAQVFDGVRLQVNQASGGAQTPWMVSALSVGVKFFQATAQAPTTLLPACGVTNIPIPPLVRTKLTRARYHSYSADEAYRIAIERDSLETYQWFVEDFPTYHLAGQVWHIINRRRESILWHRALVVGTTAAYWNYLDAYPRGVYIHEANYWLRSHRAPLLPRDYRPVPIILPPGYRDEAYGLAYVVERGHTAKYAVFGDTRPIYVTPAQRWTPPTTVIVVRPPPPPPPRTLIVNNITVIQRNSTETVQPVPHYIGGCAGTREGCVTGQRERELREWQVTLNRQNEAVAKQYHAPVVATTSIVLPPKTQPSHPVGIQIAKPNPNVVIRPPLPDKPLTTPGKPAIGVKPTTNPSVVTTTPPGKPVTPPGRPEIGHPTTPSVVTTTPPGKPVTPPGRPAIGHPTTPSVVTTTPPGKPVTPPGRPAIGHPTTPSVVTTTPPGKPVTPPGRPTIGHPATPSVVTTTPPGKPVTPPGRPTIGHPATPSIVTTTPPGKPVTPPGKPVIGHPTAPSVVTTTPPGKPVTPPGRPTIGGKPTAPVVIRAPLPDKHEPSPRPTIGSKPTAPNVVTTTPPGRPVIGKPAPGPAHQTPQVHESVAHPPPVHPTTPAIHPQPPHVQPPTRETVAHPPPAHPPTPAIHPQPPHVQPPTRETVAHPPPVHPAPQAHPEPHRVQPPPVHQSVAHPPPARPEPHHVQPPPSHQTVAHPPVAHPQPQHAPPPHPQPQHVQAAPHPAPQHPAPHPAGCPAGEHMANGHCVR
jgi:hypothetical protein